MSLKHICDDSRTVTINGITYQAKFSVYRDYRYRAKHPMPLLDFEITVEGNPVHVDKATFEAIREECRILRKREYKERCRRRNAIAREKAAARKVKYATP